MGWFRRNEHDEEQLSAYVDGELSAREAEIVERHIASCSACSALVEDLRQARALLSSLPSQTPRRSFVLGAEYARPPVREAASARRFGFAMAPAVALTVFLALVVVDVGNFSSRSSDDSNSTFTALSTEKDDRDAVAGGAATAAQAPAPDSANTAADGQQAESAGGAGSALEPASAPAEAGTGVTSSEGPPADLRSTGATATGEAEASSATAADEAAREEVAPSPEAAPLPVDIEAPAEDSEGGGVSTLRILQIVAGACFLASAFYVFVRPHLFGKGS